MSETLEPALQDHLDERADRLITASCERKLRFATAESCAGGMLAALPTDIEGASHGFELGFVTYSEDSKADVLGIERSLLAHNEAVSEVVARAMAEGALTRSTADLALAVTGFADPNTEQGLVHFGLARRAGPTMHREKHFGAIGRGKVRLNSLDVMLEMLEQAIEQA